MINRTTFFGIILLLAVAFQGCAAPKVKTGPRIVWPELPEQPKIEFVRNIYEPRDLGFKKHLVTRFLETFLGEKQPPRIITPISIFVDKRERIFVADTGLQVVHIFDVKKEKYSQVFKIPNGRLMSPIGVTVDKDENIYVTDSVLNVIAVYSTDYKFKKAIKIADFKRLSGIIFNKANAKLYVVDTGSHKIYVLDTDGTKLFEIGGRGSSDTTFNFPTHIVSGKNGDIYITDSLNFRVVVMDKDGNFIRKIGKLGRTIGSFSKPKGVALDSASNVYIVDGLYDTVQIFNSKAELLLTFGSSGTKDGAFWLPAGIHIDSNDNIYVADGYNKRVSVFHFLGQDDDAGEQRTETSEQGAEHLQE